ncbi:uncharacterized protein LOC121737618 isoform X2 [Aricia agestis]|nr:uncharacterized protein LOC121737618 isoform X2 [Aricia agestis]
MSCDKQDTRVSRVLENNLPSNVILNSLLKDCFVQINVCNDPLASLESDYKKSISNKHNYTGKRKKQDMVPNSEESLTPDETMGFLNNDSVFSSPEENFIQIKEDPTFCEVATQKNYDGFSVDKFRESNESIQFYTGFDNYQEFTYIFDAVFSLKPWKLNHKCCPQSGLTKNDEFFLTMMKLKQGTPDFVLSQLFNLSVDSVFTVFENWLTFMYNNWATQHLPHKNLMDIKMLNGVSEMYEADLKGLCIINVPEFLKGKKRLQNLTFRGKGKVNAEETPIQMKEFKILVEPMTSKYLPLWSKIYFACCILSGYKEGRALKKT